MATNIILIHLGRCGSTVLASLLNQHSRITWYGEIFEPMLRQARKRHGDFFRLKGDPVALACRVLDAAETEYAGIEVKPFHFTAFNITPAAFMRGMRQAGPHRFIVLDRRNRLRKIVSSRIAFNTGVWHVPLASRSNGQRLKLKLAIEDLRLDLKGGTLTDILQQYDSEFTEIRRLLTPDYLDLLYEEHVQDDPMSAYRKVIRYLGLPEDPVMVKLGRTTPNPLSEVLENYREVADHLKGTRYAWMPDE